MPAHDSTRASGEIYLHHKFKSTIKLGMLTGYILVLNAYVILNQTNRVLPYGT